MKKIITIGVLSLVLAGTVGAGVASAQEPPIDTIPTGFTTATAFVNILEDITDWIFVFLLVVAVIMIVLAGVQFIIGGGEPTQVSQARTKLIWAGVGVAVALLARGLPAAIQNIIAG